jgi:prepilin-type N-terminal cleavage/methylation domain-containing protein
MDIFKTIKEKKGVTLIELLVVIVMISLTLAGVTGIFRHVVKGQARALTSQQLMDQSSYVIEYMGRALRMAKKDAKGECITDNSNYQKTKSGNGIKFMNYKEECQEFYLDTGTNQMMEVRDGVSNELSSEKIEIVSFNIGPDTSWDQNLLQPRVTIFLESKGKREMLTSEEQPTIKIQTTVSQRNISL